MFDDNVLVFREHQDENNRVSYCRICAQIGHPNIRIKWQNTNGKWIPREFSNSPPSFSDSQAPDFVLHVDGNDPAPANFPGSGSGTTVMIAPGQYAVFATKPTPPPQYNVGYSSDCVGEINDGETKTCTVTNTRVG